MNKIRKVVISFMLMGTLAASLWLAALAQSEPENNAGQTHQLYLPLINHAGDELAVTQGENPFPVDEVMPSDDVLSEESADNDVAAEEILVDDTVYAALAPSIRVNDVMAKFFGIRANSNHGWITDNCGFRQGTPRPPKDECGNSDHYKAWIDGPMNPYKHGGHTYFQISHSENYRIKVPNHNWGNPPLWTMSNDTMLSARQLQEEYYDNRHWIFSVRNVNGALYGLTHHEWYAPGTIKYVGGIPFLNSESFNYWITAIGWVSSTNGGSTWQMKPPTSGSARLVVVPEPSLLANRQQVFGFAHPSNIVKSGSYYYFFASSVHYGHASTKQFKSGVSLFRTTAITQPTGWQYWNGSGWTRIDHSTYQGNFGRQMPYVFWERTGDIKYHTAALNVRYHTLSKTWIIVGSQWCMPGAPDNCEKLPVFSWLKNLAAPTNLPEPRAIANFSTPFVASQPYYSFFDVSGSADDNYQNIGNNPLLVMGNETGQQDIYYHQFLTLSGFQ
jgi:hypothetical protein